MAEGAGAGGEGEDHSEGSKVSRRGAPEVRTSGAGCAVGVLGVAPRGDTRKGKMKINKKNNPPRTERAAPRH